MIKFFRNIRKNLINEGKTTSYIKYAIGEIVLVMIGILLALQVNNWNEELKKNELRTKYLSSLVEDLKKDTALIANQYRFYAKDTTRINGQITRIKNNMSSIDTLKKIARYEFETDFQLISSFSNKTYLTLINTGDIDLFDTWLVEELSKIDQIQKLAIEVYDLNMEVFSRVSSIYNQRFPFHDNALAGDYLNSIWENVDKNELLAKFNLLISTKKTAAENVMQFLPTMYKQTGGLLIRIQDKYPNLSEQ